MKKIAVIATTTLLTFTGVSAAHANGNAWGDRARSCMSYYDFSNLGQALKWVRDTHGYQVVTPEMVLYSHACD